MLITISTILSLTPTTTFLIICNMPTNLSLDTSGCMYVPLSTLEDAVVSHNSPKSCYICTDRMGVPFVSSNLSDNDFFCPASRRSFPSYLWYTMMWHISTSLILPPLCFCRALPMIPNVLLAIYLSMILLFPFTLLIFPHATSYFTICAKNLDI